MKALAIPMRTPLESARDWAATAAATQRKLDETLGQLTEITGDNALLVAVLAAHNPAMWSYADPTRPSTAFIHVFTAVGQLSWPVHQDDMPLFEHVPYRHGANMIRRTAQQRSEMLRELAERLADDSKMVDALEAVR